MDEIQKPLEHLQLKQSDMTGTIDTFPFLQLAKELQIEVLKYYFGKYDLSIGVELNWRDNCSVDDLLPYNKAAGKSNEICVLWTSPDIHAQAVKALHECFSGKLELLNFIDFYNIYFMHAKFSDQVNRKWPRFSQVKIITIKEESNTNSWFFSEFGCPWKLLPDFLNDGKSLPNLERIEVLCKSFPFSFIEDFELRDAQAFADKELDEQLVEWAKYFLPQTGGFRVSTIRRANGLAVLYLLEYLVGRSVLTLVFFEVIRFPSSPSTGKSRFRRSVNFEWTTWTM